MLKWLTLEKIKWQLRIEQDFTEEDELLEMYGESEEETVLNLLGRSYEDIIEVYGRVPAPLVHATLMLVDLSYKHRSPIDQSNMSLVPYAFDILIKPYARLASSDNERNNYNYGCKNL
ncbi:MAG: head-tail connector protein [Prevotella sp.]|nr:head-tail connector protein [Prevotella sp.]